MFNTKALVLALSFTAVSFTANAADYAATVVGPGQFTFQNTAPAASFTDRISFSVLSSSDLVGTISGTSFKNFTLSAFDLYTSSNTLVSTGSFDNLAGKASVGFISDSGLTGNYYLLVSGTTSGGTYNGNISLSPVPEPESYAMMLAGLGLMGFVARRRRA